MSTPNQTAEPAQCDPELGCGQIDNHPKMHYGNATLHHDCLPPQIEQDATRFADQLPMQQALVATINTCRAGTQGDDLREAIQMFATDVVEPVLNGDKEFVVLGPTVTLDSRPEESSVANSYTTED